MALGSLCISIDVERAWGIWDKPSPEYFRLCLSHEARVIDELVKLFDRFQISATWAVVGRLLERDPSRPGAESLWHGPESIARIAAAKQQQELGSHSYAHPYYGGLGREAAAADLAAARRVHGLHHLDFATFVFPRNDVAHLDLLALHGIKVFRSVDQGLHVAIRRRMGKLLGRAANLLDKVLPVPPVAVAPIVHENGLVELPSSMLLMSRKGARRAIHPRAIELKARFGLDAAVRSGRVFHLWFHPSNFYYQSDVQLGILERILSQARELRERGLLAVRTMGSFAVPAVAAA